MQSPEPTPRAVSLRAFVWTAIGALTLATAGFAYSQLPRDRVEGPPGNPFGPGAVCTETEYVTGSGWQCDIVDMDVAHVPVIAATPYNGQCAHLKVVDASWACIAALPAAATS
ncbi:MAG TPA: hypothetical protein VGK79_06910 [Gaiellaceae bacterium]